MRDNNPPPLTVAEVVRNTSTLAAEKPRCQCDKPQGFAVYLGPNAGWVICAECSRRLRAMTRQDWNAF